MLSENLVKAFNAQINAEMWSSNLYLSMSVYFAQNGYDGMASWMRAQSKEELNHAYEMIDFVIKRNGNVEIGQINVVPTAWGSVLEVFEHVYQHECHVSKLIDDLLDVAIKENDKAAQNFINKFVDEQVEEESTAQTIVDRIKMMNGHNLIYLDDKLGERNYISSKKNEGSLQHRWPLVLLYQWYENKANKDYRDQAYRLIDAGGTFVIPNR